MSDFRILVGALAAAAALAGASVAQAAGDLTVSATLTAACELSSGATLGFGNVVALASTADQTATSTGFQIACTNGLTPKIFSATTREMAGSGVPVVPFALCLGTTCTGSNAIGTATGSRTTVPDFTSDGSMKTVGLAAKMLTTNFSTLAADGFTLAVAITVEYD